METKVINNKQIETIEYQGKTRVRRSNTMRDIILEIMKKNSLACNCDDVLYFEYF